MKKVLLPRKVCLDNKVLNSEKVGWVGEDCEVPNRIENQRNHCLDSIASKWVNGGFDPVSDRTMNCKRFVDDVLKPWSFKALKHYEFYQKWRKYFVVCSL